MNYKMKIVLSVCIVSLFLTTIQNDLTTSHQNNIDQVIASELGIDYKKIDNLSYVQSGNLMSSTEYNSDGKPTKIFAGNKKDSTIEVDTTIEYDSSNKIDFIQTLNQEISFNKTDNNLNKVELNGSVMFENIKEGNTIVQEFANGTSITKESLNLNKYSIDYGSLSSYDIQTDTSGNPFQIQNLKTKEISFYNYEESGNVNFYSKNNITIKKDNYVSSYKYFGNEILINNSNKLTNIKLSNSNTSFSFKKIKKKNDEQKILLNNKEIFSFKLKDGFDNIKLYRNIFDDVEENKYSKLGHLTSIFKNDFQTLSYSYDDFGKLISSTNNKNKSKYKYDNAGNLVYEETNNKIVEYKYENENNKNQLTSLDKTLLKYDDFGNLINYGDNSYNWEAGTLLTNSIVNNITSFYEYGIDKLRNKKVVDGNVTTYEYFNGLLIASNNDYGSIQYIYDNENTAIGFVFKEQLYIYVKDSLGIIRGVIDSNYNPIIKYEYDDWGLPSVTFSNSEVIEKVNDIIYKDYVYDKETSLYYLGSRYYNPKIRRFISQDSLEKVSELSSKDYNFNLYSYCNNNPIMLSDGNGYEPISIAVSAVLLLVGCVIALITAKLLTNAILKVAKQTYSPYYPEINGTFDKTEHQLYNIVSLVKQAVTLAIAGSLVTIWMWWKKDDKKDEGHHIVAKTAPRAYIARDIYNRQCGYNLNKYPNIVFIKYRLHKHLHTTEYYDAINSCLKLAYLTKNKNIVWIHVMSIIGSKNI